MKILVFISTTLFSLCLYFSWAKGSSDSNRDYRAKGASSPHNSIVTLEGSFSPDTQAYAFVLPPLPVVQGLNSNRAEDCGACHKEIYNDWKASTHAHAGKDLQFLAELSKKESPEWLCLNCHLPLQNQRKNYVRGLVGGDVLKPFLEKNPNLDTKLQSEGVTCAVCHIRKDEKTGKSTIIGPTAKVLAPHPVIKNKEHLHNMCDRCHNPKGESITPNLLCWFTTVKENADIENSSPLKKNCVECHMPEQLIPARGDTSGLKTKKVNRHFWWGGGIPKLPELLDFVGKRGYQKGLEVEVKSFVKQKNGSLNIPLVLTNKYAGHDIPTGDPERFIQVTLQILTKGGKTVTHKQHRIGQVWKWNPAKKVSDNRIKAGEARKLNFEIPPKQLQDAQRVQVKITAVKLTSKNAGYMTQAKLTRPELLKNSQDKIKQIGKHYPMARILFLQEHNLSGKIHKTWSTQELESLTRKELDVPLSQREY